MTFLNFVTAFFQLGESKVLLSFFILTCWNQIFSLFEFSPLKNFLY